MSEAPGGESGGRPGSPHGSHHGSLPGSLLRGLPERLPLRSPRLWFVLTLFALLALLPLAAGLAGQPYYVTLMSRVMIYAIAAAGLNLLLGYGGLVSFGHAMYLSIGAYAVAIAAFHGITSAWLQLALALACGALIAAVTGLVSLRTHGMAFIMITLAFAQMWLYLMGSLKHYGGDDGLRLERHGQLFPLDLADPRQLYYLCLAVVAATLYGSWRLVHSRYGYALRGSRANPRRMRGLGWPVLRLQLLALVLAGTIGALAGFLLANLTAYASPAYGAWNVSGELIVMVIAGGLGTVVGPLVGAGVLLLAEEALSSSSLPWLADHWPFVIGAGILLLVSGSRRGLYGAMAQWADRLAPPAGPATERPTTERPTTEPSTTERPLTVEPRMASLPAAASAPTSAPAMPAPLRVTDLSKRFGGLVVTDQLSLSIEGPGLHALIGPNGAGKTTLIGQLCGEIHPDAGRIELVGHDVTRWPIERRARLGLARCHQITQLCGDLGTRENLMLALLAGTRGIDAWRPMQADGMLIDQAQALLRQVGLADRANTPAAELAHGEQRQLELAMALARRPVLLLLDEPLAGMSGAESATMVTLLRELAGRLPMLLVEHDMDAVFGLADRITVLVNGRAIASGTPDAIRADPAVRAAYLGDGT